MTNLLNCKRIFLALTTRCNVHCEKCWRTETCQPGEDISSHVLQKFFTIFSQYNGSIFIGSGESTITDKLESFVNWLNESKATAVILTNGKRLLTLSDKYFSKKLKWGVTFDGFYNSELENFQFGVNIEEIKENVRIVKKTYPQAHVYLNYTLTTKNAQSLLRFMEFGKECNIKEIYITPLKGFVDFNEEKIIPFIPNLEETNVRLIIGEAISFAEQNKIRINNPFEELAFVGCKVRSVSPIIHVNGDVLFCYDREDIIVGSLLDDYIFQKFSDCVDQREIICAVCSVRQKKIRDDRGLYYRWYFSPKEVKA
jgi:MoaA/NifB/PqqE/SkfB family radical SAM enzyme